MDRQTKVSGTVCAKHPPGRSGKRFLTPLSALPLLFVLVVALAFAAVRQSTPLVWNDSPHLSAVFIENHGKLWPCEESVNASLQFAFRYATACGYRPLSTFICYSGTRYLAFGGSIFLWSLIVGGLIGSFLFAMYRVALRIIGSRTYAVLAVVLLACSSPFVAASWIIFAGLQVLVPLFICLGLLTYWHIQDSGWRSRWGHVGLVLILLVGPWFREFIGLTAILVAMLNVIERRQPTWITLICALGLAHALFPGWIMHHFLATAPTDVVFHIGTLGSRIAATSTASHWGWLKFRFDQDSQLAVQHFLCQLPSPILLLMVAATVIKSAASFFAWWRIGRPLSPRRLGRETMLVWFTVAWWLGSLLPLVRVFTEEVHLCYALVPFSILAAVAARYMVTTSRGLGVLRTALRVTVVLLVAVGVGDQVLNVPNSIRIVRGINRGVQQAADKIRETTPAGAVIVGNALHLDDICLASGGHFRSYWTVTAGIPYSPERAFLTRESLIDFMAKHDKAAVYFLDMDYDFIPYKRGYHSHRFVRTRDFEVQKLWSMSSIDIRYPFLDPAKNVTARELTNVLFPPDLENDFYQGRAVNQAPFMREVYVNYTLYKVIGENTNGTVLTLEGDSDDPLHSPRCLTDQERFWEVSGKRRQSLIASLNRPLTLQGITLSSGQDAVDRMPSTVTVLGSQEGAIWQFVETVATDGWRPNETKTVAVSSKKPFSQYKLSFAVPNPNKILRVYGLNLSFVEAEIDRSVSRAAYRRQLICDKEEASMWKNGVRAALAALIFALTLSGVMAWHCRNQRVPQDDCANLACTSLEIYQTWEQQGIVAGLKAFYAHNGWRPILLPNLTALLVFVFRGNVVRAASTALVLAWIVLYVFTYRCFRVQLERVPSAVCASFLTTLPPYFVYSCVFFADLPMLACLTAALYYAQRFHASKCTSLGQGVCAGLWVALALTFRPLEPVPAAGCFLLVLAASGLRQKTLCRGDLLLALATAFVVAVVLLLRVRDRHFAWWAPVVMAAIVGLYVAIVYRARSRLNVAFAAGMAVVLLGVGVWYAPRMRGLASWVWQCSFGDMIHLYKGNGSLGPSAAITLYLQQLGGWQLAGVALLSAVVLPFAYKRRPLTGGFFMAIGAAQVALVLLLTMLMEGSDLRRGLAGFYHLFIGLTLFSAGHPVLRVGGATRLTWLRVVPIAAFALLQTALIWTAAGGHFLPDAGQTIYAKVGGYMLARPREDQNRGTFLEVQRRVPPDSTICCLSLAVHTFEARAFCPEALNLLALENRQNIRFGYPWNFQDLSAGYRQLAFGGLRPGAARYPRCGSRRAAVQASGARVAADSRHDPSQPRRLARGSRLERDGPILP